MHIDWRSGFETSVRVLRALGSYIVDLVYPPECFICHRSLGIDKVLSVCKHCYKHLPWIFDCCCSRCGVYLAGGNPVDRLECLRCQQNRRFFDSGFSVLNFTGDVKPILWSFKYHRQLEWARLFAIALLRKRRGNLKKQSNLCVTYVPLSFRRFYWRGFNQSFLIAYFVSRLIRKPLKRILKRKRFEVSQVKLKAKRRGKNVINAFSLKSGFKKHNDHAAVLLIDDVMTTGATLNECSKILKNKFKSVCVASLFSVPGLEPQRSKRNEKR